MEMEFCATGDLSKCLWQNKNNSYWGKSSLYSDDYFLPNNIDRISNNSNTSRIFALNIYMDDGFVYYTRTFKKIFVRAIYFISKN